MSQCFQCHQTVREESVTCPHCGAVLKAYGHPGIDLHRASGETSLCQTCTYHEDDTCTFPQRPHAKTCTLYHNVSEPLTEDLTPLYKISRIRAFKAWCQRKRGLLLLLILIMISVVVAFF